MYICFQKQVMIVNAMTPKEVYKEIKGEHSSLIQKISEETEKSHRKFIKAIIFPTIYKFRWKSPENNNWNVIMMARYRNERKRPAYIPYLKYETVGIGAYYPKLFDNNVCVFDFRPHFFKRYRERCLIPNGIDSLTFDEQIEHFFLNSGLFGMNFGDGKDDKYIGYTQNGILLGTIIREDNYICVKTYVSIDMLFSNQMETLEYFSESRKHILANPEYFKNRETFFKLDGKIDT